MDDSRIRKASDLLGALLSPEVAMKADAWSRFFGFWTRAAGESLAAHSRPVDVRNGIVFVEATHPGWIQLLQMDQDRILGMIRTSFPELAVSGIAFRLAKDASIPGTLRTTRPVRPESELQGGQTPEKAEAASVGRAPGAGKAPSVAQTIQGVADESFRGILSSLAETLDQANKDDEPRKPHKKEAPGRP